MLCREGERILRSRGHVEVVLWVFEANERARKFYEAMGFAADGSTKVLTPGAPLTAVRYRKALEDAEPGSSDASPSGEGVSGSLKKHDQ